MQEFNLIFVCTCKFKEVIFKFFPMIRINLQSDSYIPMAGCSVLTVISNIWALVGSKKFSQEWDENVKTCLTLKGKNSRIPMAALYVLACAGIVLALVAVISGKLPVYP